MGKEPLSNLRNVYMEKEFFKCVKSEEMSTKNLFLVDPKNSASIRRSSLDKHKGATPYTNTHT